MPIINQSIQCLDIFFWINFKNHITNQPTNYWRISKQPSQPKEKKIIYNINKYGRTSTQTTNDKWKKIWKFFFVFFSRKKMNYYHFDDDHRIHNGGFSFYILLMNEWIINTYIIIQIWKYLNQRIIRTRKNKTRIERIIIELNKYWTTTTTGYKQHVRWILNVVSWCVCVCVSLEIDIFFFEKCLMSARNKCESSVFCHRFFCHIFFLFVCMLRMKANKYCVMKEEIKKKLIENYWWWTRWWTTSWNIFLFYLVDFFFVFLSHIITNTKYE